MIQEMLSMSEQESIKEFYLDDEAEIIIDGLPSNDKYPNRWFPVMRCEDKRIALLLQYGEKLRVKRCFFLNRDSVLFIRFIVTNSEISTPGLIMKL